jgi:putative ABC transport system permease protein
VVGVVSHVKRWGALRDQDRPNIYRLVPATYNGTLAIVVRTTPGAAIPASALRNVATSVGPRVLIDRIESGADLLGANIKTPRQRTILLSLLGSLGLLLTLVGIASVTAFAVARRTREIGVRMAFGAEPHSVVWTMMRDAAWPMVLGLAVGLGASVYATKLVGSFLFETTPTDPVTFAAAAIVLAVTAAIAAWLPARRAARVDPVQALRSE